MLPRDDDYRAMAEECFRRARESESEQDRQGYLGIGANLARSRIEGGLWSVIVCPAVTLLAIGRNKNS